MGLRKDDPIYYKVKFNELFQQALKEGLQIQCQHTYEGVRISFVADNGDVAGVELSTGSE
jgi:hypothetical protein